MIIIDSVFLYILNLFQTGPTQQVALLNVVPQKLDSTCRRKKARFGHIMITIITIFGTLCVQTTCYCNLWKNTVARNLQRFAMLLNTRLVWSLQNGGLLGIRHFLFQNRLAKHCILGRFYLSERFYKVFLETLWMLLGCYHHGETLLGLSRLQNALKFAPLSLGFGATDLIRHKASLWWLARYFLRLIYLIFFNLRRHFQWRNCFGLRISRRVLCKNGRKLLTFKAISASNFV